VTDDFVLACPVPLAGDETIKIAHGGGGRATERLLDTIFRPLFDGPELAARHDGATLAMTGPLAFTTDSYVIRPLEFPGGSIGTLAVNGTVNDLAMCGARPQFVSAAFILEEGLDTTLLARIATEMASAARAAGVRIVTGDLKVVDRGKADGMFITTSGIGTIVARSPIAPSRVAAGDAIILSGDIGRHGMAVMAAREGFGFDAAIESDCAPLAAPVLDMIEAGVDIHCLRDLTRGGLASALVEIATTARLAVEVEESRIAVRTDVATACEILGLDPFHVANEGRFVAFVPEHDVERALSTLHRRDVTREAQRIGIVVAGRAGRVACRNAIGSSRIVDMLSGEQLPRIC
jgi:hydrogenase expression/formation protein HypE